MTQGNATERRSSALARHGRDAHIISSNCYMNNEGIVTMVKQIAFHDQALHSMKRGVDVVAGAVKFTLGPRGRNVAIDRRFGPQTRRSSIASRPTGQFDQLTEY